MSIPNFTADSTTYRSTRNYRARGSGSGFRGYGRSHVVPQQRSFACLPDDSACACHGMSDCIDCVNLGHCSGHCECDVYGTCVCSA